MDDLNKPGAASRRTGQSNGKVEQFYVMEENGQLREEKGRVSE